MTRTDPGNRSAADTFPVPGPLDRAAPLLFVLLWSSSFIGARLGLRHMSPLWFVALRMVLASAIMTGAMLVTRRPWTLSRTQWMHCAVVGITTQALLLMPAHVAMTHTEAAPIALIQTLNPLLTALLAWPLLGERLRPAQGLGLALGVAGVLLILGVKALNSHAELPALLATVAGVCALSGGTLYYRRFCRDLPPFPAVTAQFLACAAVCVASAVLLEPFWTDGDVGAYLGIAWNTIAVSIGGMALYFLMLARGTAARATVNFYLVPGVTSLLTWAFLGETLTAVMLLGLVVSSAGCWLVGRRPAG
jgi:drug/metabolite transporter (DMT)-like permease